MFGTDGRESKVVHESPWPKNTIQKKFHGRIRNCKGRINHHSLFVTTFYQLCKDWSTSTSIHHQLLSFPLRACNLHITQVKYLTLFALWGRGVGGRGTVKLSSLPRKKLSSSEISKFHKGGTYHNIKDHSKIRIQLSPKKRSDHPNKKCSSHSKDYVQATKNFLRLIAEIALGFYVLNLFELKIDSPMATDFVSKDTWFYLTQNHQLTCFYWDGVANILLVAVTW